MRWNRLVLGLVVMVGIILGASIISPESARAQSGSDDADKVCVYGDIDNLGFKFPAGFDVFSGKSTPSHSYPWPSKTNTDPSPGEAPGTDRIMVGTSVKATTGGGHANARDGYAGGTKRAVTEPQALKLKCDRGSVDVKSVAMQLFVDDFQAPVFKSKFTATINGKHFPALEQVINALNQTGPVGKLVTIAVPSNLVNDVLNGSLLIDDETTGIGDGYSLDFERTLLNPHLTVHAGTVTGKVTDATSGKPIEGATVSAAGTVQTTTAVDGTFRLPEVVAGLAVVTATAPGHIHKTTPLDVIASTTKTLDFALLPGADTSSPPAQSGPSTSAQPANRTRSTFASSVVAVSDISTKGKDLARSAIVAVVLLLLIVFPAELFNTTLSEHYDEVKSWFGPVGRGADRVAAVVRRIPQWVGFALFAIVGALIGSLLDPHIGLDRGSIALFVGLITSFAAVTLAFGLLERNYMTHTHEDPGRLQVLPGTLLVAAASVLVSRLAGYQPGYLYGVLAGFVFAHELERNEEGRLTTLSSLLVLIVSLIAWIVWTPIGHMAAHANPNIVTLLLDAILVAIFVTGLQSLVFGLVPLRFLEGEPIFRWNRLAWLGIYLVTLFAFVHILLHPGVAYQQSNSGHAFVVSLVLFIAFGVVSVAFWAYFRSRGRTADSSA